MRLLAFIAILAAFAAHGANVGMAKFGDLGLNDNVVTNIDLSDVSLDETDPTVSSWAKAATKPSYAWNEIASKPTFAAVASSGSYNDLSNKPTIPIVPTNVSAFNNDAGYLTSYAEIDPNVPAWAKAAEPPQTGVDENTATNIAEAVTGAHASDTNNPHGVTAEQTGAVEMRGADIGYARSDVGWDNSVDDYDEPGIDAGLKVKNHYEDSEKYELLLLNPRYTSYYAFRYVVSDEDGHPQSIMGVGMDGGVCAMLCACETRDYSVCNNLAFRHDIDDAIYDNTDGSFRSDEDYELRTGMIVYDSCEDESYSVMMYPDDIRSIVSSSGIYSGWAYENNGVHRGFEAALYLDAGADGTLNIITGEWDYEFVSFDTDWASYSAGKSYVFSFKKLRQAKDGNKGTILVNKRELKK